MRTRRAASLAAVVLLAATVSAQITFEEAVGGLSSKDPKVRLHSATLLKESAYVESAIPLAKLVSDPDNAVQLEAIAAELAIFTAGRSGPKRVGIVTIEDRSRPVAQQVFDAGPLVLGPAPVPPVVLLVMRLAALDDSAQVCAEAIYGFGALGSSLSGKARRDLLQSSQTDLATVMTLAIPALRIAAVRAIGRVYEHRPGDPPIDQKLGNALINAVNEPDRAMKIAAMDTVGLIRERRAVEGLTQLFEFYGDGDLGQAAFGALTRIGDKSSVPALRAAALPASRRRCKILAIEGLARTGDASHIPAIQDALNREGDPRVIDAGISPAAMLINGSIERTHRVAQPAEVARPRAAIPRRDRARTRRPADRVRAGSLTARARPTSPISSPSPTIRRALPVVATLVKDMDKQVAASRGARGGVAHSGAVKLPRSFYNRPTLDVARDLIGKVLVHNRRGVLTSGVIVEVEAYIGESDPACHAAPGPTKRNAPLYGPPGLRTSISITACTGW